MRKIIFTVVFIIMFRGLTHGTIEKKVDSFDGTVSVVSTIRDIPPCWAYLLFIRLPSRSAIAFNIEEYEWWFFDRIEIKIDEHNYKPMTINKESDIVPVRNILHTSIIIDVTSYLAEIKQAKAITVRAIFNNRPSLTWSVPQNILDEWKQAASMTFD